MQESDLFLFQSHASSRQLHDLGSGPSSLGIEGDDGSNLSSSQTQTLQSSVLTVRTPRELQLGIERGFQHIEIKEHLDLSELEPVPIAGAAGLTALLGSIPPEVWTIRVCATQCCLHSSVAQAHPLQARRRSISKSFQQLMPLHLRFSCEPHFLSNESSHVGVLANRVAAQVQVQTT
jgi:hypothetical protein